MSQQKQKGGSSAKHGRNKKWCEVYKISARRIGNKIKRLQRHINRNRRMIDQKIKKGRDVSYDLQARNALKRLSS